MTAFLRRRLKHIADVRFSNVDKLAEAGEAPVRLCNYTDVYNNERIDAAMPFMTATATTAEIRRFRLHVGDVILTKDSESPTDIAVPAVVASTAADLVCGYHLAMVRPRRGVLLGRYLQRALQADGIRQQFYLSANGVTRFGLSQDAIGNALVPVPPLRNQEVIADFLDMRTLAIDAGRQDKLRAGDILGALTGEAGLQAAEIGKIDLFATRAYVAISRARFDAALQQLRNGRIKGRNFRVRGL